MSDSNLAGLRALTFDVFGTVADWRGSIIREGRAFSARKGLSIDWEAFADAWRGAYGPSMQRVRTGELPWTKLDDLHRASLVGLLAEFRIDGLTEADVDDFNLV